MYRNYVFRCLSFPSSIRLHKQWISQKFFKYWVHTICLMLKFYKIIWENPSVGTKGTECFLQRAAQDRRLCDKNYILPPLHRDCWCFQKALHSWKSTTSSASQKLIYSLRGRIQALSLPKTERMQVSGFCSLSGAYIQGTSRPWTWGDIVLGFLNTL